MFQAFYKTGGRLANTPLAGCESQFRAWLNDSDPHDVYEKYSDCISKNGAKAESCLNESVTEAEKDYLECYTIKMTSSTWHMGGTTRLGSCDDAEAVVDNRCRYVQLHKIDADSPTSPTLGSVKSEYKIDRHLV